MRATEGTEARPGVAKVRGTGVSGLQVLLPYLKPFRGRMIFLGVPYAALSAGAAVGAPTLLGLAVDDLLAGGVRSGALALYAIGLVVLSATLALFRYLLRMLGGGVAAGVSYKMAQDYFDRLLVLDCGVRRRYGEGDLFSRGTNDLIYIWKLFSAAFQMTMYASFVILTSLALTASASPLLAGVVAGSLVIGIGTQLWVGRVLEHLFGEVQRSMGRLSAFADEHLHAAPTLAAYAQEEKAIAAFEGVNRDYAKKNLEFVLRSGAIAPLPQLVSQLATALVLLVGGLLIISGGLSVGRLVQFAAYLGLLATATRQLGRSYERLQQGAAAAGRIGEVIQRAPEVSDAPDPVPVPKGGALRFENVGVRAGGRWVLRGVDLEVPPGTTLGIVGATGTGKSTLLSLVGRVRDPEEGRVLIGDADVREISLKRLRKALAYVPQETLLFGMTLRENITLGLHRSSRERVDRAIRAASLNKDLPQLAGGLDTVVGERGTTLSGGQKQRTAIARALVREPRFLLLDDALSSVDARTAAEILERLKDATPGSARLVVAQKLEAVRDADRIVVLDEGCVRESGTHEELLEKGGRYWEMHRRETRKAVSGDG